MGLGYLLIPKKR